MKLLAVTHTRRTRLSLALAAAAATFGMVEMTSADTSARRLGSATHLVTSCADDGSAGTLRAVLANPATVSGDTVDLSQLTCASITLGSEIKIHQDDLTLIGPGPYLGYLGIGAQSTHEVIQHFGYGTLQLVGLSLVNGSFASDTDPTGGCVWSRGSVALVDSRVTRCQVFSVSSGSIMVKGGAVYTRKDLSLTRSTISYSHAYSTFGGHARGGGAYVGGVLTSIDSRFERSVARSTNGNAFGSGGAAFAHGGATVESTTVNSNVADRAAGIMVYNPFPNGTATIVSSTISGNSALDAIGGLYSNLPLDVSNSTIAFNRSRGSSGWADGLYAGAAIKLTSTIVADNGGVNGLSDFGVVAGAAVTGGNNLIFAVKSGTPVPPLTVDDCPKLDPLLNSGGHTPTHGLRIGSATIDAGDSGTAMTDQRGFARIVGPDADMGSVERQASDRDERILSTSFEGPCDF